MAYVNKSASLYVNFVLELIMTFVTCADLLSNVITSARRGFPPCFYAKRIAMLVFNTLPVATCVSEN